MGFKRVIAVEMDDDWYVIPIELKDEFNDLENSILYASTEEDGDNYYKLTDEFNVGAAFAKPLVTCWADY